jgi:hypothetical protein
MNYFKKNNIYIIILVIIILISLLSTVVLYFATGFEKTITVKEKYTRYRRRSSNYNIVDTDNNIYQIGNVWFKGDFNRAEDYALVIEGDRIRVKGYGIRVPILDMYKKIYEIKKV